MIPVGYMYKRIEKNPEGFGEATDVYSLSGCVSGNFADYINYWKHNGYWLFDFPSLMDEIAQSEGVDLEEMTLFYYEVYENEYVEDAKEWVAFAPDSSFETNVKAPANKHLEGFDVTTFSGHSNPECSPLSCNDLATPIAVNEHCLIRTFAEAKEALEVGMFNHSEPGPFRIFAVYSVPMAKHAA